MLPALSDALREALLARHITLMKRDGVLIRDVRHAANTRVVHFIAYDADVIDTCRYYHATSNVETIMAVDAKNAS